MTEVKPERLPKLGDILLFHVVKDIGGTEQKLDWPAIVYKTYPDEPGTPIGITVFYDGVPTRYGKVMYHNKPENNCWRWIDE